MITMTDWVNIIIMLGSTKSKEAIQGIIRERCLLSPNKVYGAWQIDGDAVWDLLIAADPKCMENAEKYRLRNAISVESWLEERKYRDMRSTFPGRRRKLKAMKR